jgi:hypothetical protein
MTRSGIIQIISFFLYLFFQVLILKNIALFHTAFCFLYIAYLLLLPVETNPLALMGIGFLMGFMVDIFYDSLGMHAMSSVFIMYIRNYWLAGLTPQGGYDIGTLPNIAANGIQWFTIYAIPLVFLHHALLFYVEAGGFGLFWFTLVKVLASTFFTLVVIFIVQFLFPGRRRI